MRQNAVEISKSSGGKAPDQLRESVLVAKKGYVALKQHG